MKNNTKRLLIVKAAQKRFARHGLAKTSIEEIARDLRMAKGSIYHYFTSKEEIYYEVLSAETDRYIAEINSLLQSEEPDVFTRLASYTALKDNLQEKYTLIFEMIRLIFSEYTFDQDKLFLESLIEKETSAVSEFLESAFGKKNGDNALANYIVYQSWGQALTARFDQLMEKSGSQQRNTEVLIKILKTYLSNP